MHTLETQYLDTLAEATDDTANWVHDTTGRNGAGVYRALIPPRLDWIVQAGDGFPLLLSKRVPFGVVVAEFCWMMSGRVDVEWLDQHKAAQIWRPWALADGTIGRAYGYQIDHPTMGHQVAQAVERLRLDPTDRRACWTHWRADDLPFMALPPCHGCFCQLRVVAGKVHLHMHQRSADWCVGVPFNIAFYSLLLRVCSRLIGQPEGGLHITFGDAHLYEMHFEGAIKQLEQAQEVRRAGMEAPGLVFNRYDLREAPAASVFRSLEPSDFRLFGYKSMPAIKLGVAV